MESGSLRDHRRLGFFLPAVALSVVVACGDNGDALDSLGAIPGLAEATEVPLIKTQPDPSDASFAWSHAYKVGDLPPINVGQPTTELMGDADRDAGEADDLVCLGAGGSAGCGDPNNPRPDVSGLTYGGPDVLAWAWLGVPDQAVAVRFTDQDGAVIWQRVVDRLVIFPDTVDDDPDGECPCRFDTIDVDGVIVASVDIQTGTYINDQ